MRRKRSLKERIEAKKERLAHYEKLVDKTKKELEALQTEYKQENDELFGDYMRKLGVNSVDELKEKFNLVRKGDEPSSDQTQNHNKFM